MDTDTAFSGSVPDAYQRYMVPLLFEPYARDLAIRVAAGAPLRVLELAAGTGVATRHLAAMLPGAAIVGTDLNLAMLDVARRIGTAGQVRFAVADAASLPFGDGRFDAVACQFGVMFFADKVAAFAEARRVLRTGGRFCFNSWDSLVANEFAAAVTCATDTLFPADPPSFLARLPHGYHDRKVIARDLALARFDAGITMETLELQSVAPRARDVAVAFCQGTPLRFEIAARGMNVDEATAMVTAALESRFGTGPVAGRMSAHVITAVS